ncbi:hypothetical protein KBD18_02565 [Patescibacteria group bacterium]|nr:hypothetical protein [Patescibacteria group bacterium]
MINSEQSFGRHLARELSKAFAEDEPQRPQILRTPEAPPVITEEERHAKIDQHITQTEQFLAQSVAYAEQAYEQVVERLGKNDIYSAAFREAWDVMAAQQPYLASLEVYATKAVHDAGGTAEAAQRMEAVRQKIADAEIALDERIKLTGKAMIDGGFYERYTPGRSESNADARVTEKKSTYVPDAMEQKWVNETNKANERKAAERRETWRFPEKNAPSEIAAREKAKKPWYKRWFS